MDKNLFKSPIIITGLVFFGLIMVIGIITNTASFQVDLTFSSLYRFLVDNYILEALPIVLIVGLFLLSKIYSKPAFAAAGLFLLGIGMIVRFSFVMSGLQDFNTHKVTTTGEVFAIEKVVKQPCGKFETCISYHPQVSFKTNTGVIVKFENNASISDLIFSNLFSSSVDPLSIKVGDNVPISYDQRNPTVAYIGQSTSFFSIIVELGLILVILILGSIFIKVSRKSKITVK
jgi:hypothetical protein